MFTIIISITVCVSDIRSAAIYKFLMSERNSTLKVLSFMEALLNKGFTYFIHVFHFLMISGYLSHYHDITNVFL